MKNALLLFCVATSAVCGYAQTKDTFEIYFPFNIPKITAEAEARIDALIFKDTLIHGDKLIILGFADYVGGKGHNDTLSRQRAKNVRDYLLKYGFDKKDITLCIGKGKIERNDIHERTGYAPDRKVQIVIDRTPPAPPPAPKPKPVVSKPATRPAPLPDMKELKVNESFAINNLCFQPGSPELLDQSYPILKELLDDMVKYPTLRIRVEGHICCLGPIEGRDDILAGGATLSEARAGTVCRYLIEHGIAGNRLQAIGLGNRNPVVKDEQTEEDHIKNRRVEIRILSK
jgi:outer membrane protein OmpA-like peptidoglycan-associated protein